MPRADSNNPPLALSKKNNNNHILLTVNIYPNLRILLPAIFISFFFLSSLGLVVLDPETVDIKVRSDLNNQLCNKKAIDTHSQAKADPNKGSDGSERVPVPAFYADGLDDDGESRVHHERVGDGELLARDMRSDNSTNTKRNGKANGQSKRQKQIRIVEEECI